MKTENILNNVYDISLCSKFSDNRRRLIYKNVFPIFTENPFFSNINERITKYIEIMKMNVTLSRLDINYLTRINDKLCEIYSDIDIIDISNKSLIEIKCSESKFKIEWLIHLFMNYSLLKMSDKENKYE